MAAVVAAIVVFAAAGYVIARDTTVPQAGQTPGYSATTQAGASALAPATDAGPGTAARSAPAAAQGTGAAGAVVAFLGDDYTTGVGASSTDKRFSTLVCARLGLREKNFGIAGAGYAKAAQGRTYADRVDDIVAAHPDVVVVSGGRNDVYDDMNTLTDAAHDLFATLRQKLPDAVLVAIAPWWGDSDHPPALDQIAEAVRSAVREAGGHYLALADPLHGHPEWMADAADPNDAGYAHLADAVARALAPLLPTP